MSLPAVQTTIPLEDEPPSKRLRLVTGYFQLAAALSVLRVIFIGLLALWGPSNVATWFRDNPFQSIVGPLIGVIGMVWTAQALRARSRMAWIPAMLALAIPLALSFVGRSLSLLEFVLGVAGLLILISVRKELD